MGYNYSASIIIPVLNEAPGIRATLESLQGLRRGAAEIIVVDGGSTDGTAELVGDLADAVITSPRGRAVQMNTGARNSRGGLLVFLHVDTSWPANAVIETLASDINSGSGWGFCNVKLSGSRFAFRIIETLMNWRSRLTGIGTGDQVFLISRRCFDEAGGFPEIALMEDIALSRKLKQIAGKPVNPGITVITSSRRWEAGGIIRTVLLMWTLRLRYFLGGSPEVLRNRYYR